MGPTFMTVMLELKADLSKARMKWKNDPELLSNSLSTNKQERRFWVLIDETELVAALITTAPKDNLSSTHTRMGVLEQDMVPVTVKEIIKKISDLYWMQKA